MHYFSLGSVLASRYEVVREIGRGGCSVVYAARDRELGLDVAIKLLVPPPATAHIELERMRREVHAVRQLTHENIVAIYDFVDDGAGSFIVMELVDGPDVQVRVRDGGPLGVDEVASLGRDVAAALVAAHRHGILHRDVKPQNILLDPDGCARLADFGSARLATDATITRTGTLVGTVNYLAPEVLAGERGDARSDIYALGLTMYFALTGRLPERQSPHLPPNPSPTGHDVRAVRATVPEWLARVVARATSADPRDRFPTPQTLADALSKRSLDQAAPRIEIDVCVLCGAPEPLGLTICPRCGGAASPGADTLIFVHRALDHVEREETLTRLTAAVGSRARRAATRVVADGGRALLSVPSASVHRVLDKLSERGIPAHPVSGFGVWSKIPTSAYVLIGAVLVSGWAAAMFADSFFLWSTPALAALLMVGSERAVREPLLAGARRGPRLPDAAEEVALATFAELPPGNARAILADVVSRGQLLYAAVVRRGDPRSLAPLLVELVSAACASARDLAHIDQRLVNLEDRQGGAAVRSDHTLDVVARAERARDAAVQRLLDGIAVLDQLLDQSIRDTAVDSERLGEVTRELESEARAQASAAREIEELLLPSSPR